MCGDGATIVQYCVTIARHNTYLCRYSDLILIFCVYLPSVKLVAGLEMCLVLQMIDKLKENIKQVS